MRFSFACLKRKSTSTAILFTATDKMVRYLNVAEKNDAAKRISEILSGGQLSRRDGLSIYNKIYEFAYQFPNSQRVSMLMTSVSGHMLNYDFCSSYRSWLKVPCSTLFDAPIVRICCGDSGEKLKRTLQREVTKCDALVIWTDGDREGESIGYEIIDTCHEVRPNLPVYRAKFSEITHVSIHRAARNLGQPDPNVNAAVECRQELDLRIGAAFTRLQTLHFQRTIPDIVGNKGVISYGSCQFPTMGFVVERFYANKNFIPEQFWRLVALHYEKGYEEVEFLWQRGRLFEELPCQVLLDRCLQFPRATVEQVSSKPRKRYRPYALDTVTLEKLGSKKLKISAKDIMSIAEKMYIAGLISYPRTETNQFPKELNLVPLIEAQAVDPHWGTFASGILQSGGPNPRNGNKTDNAHPPIHPTAYSSTLQGKDKSVYELIVRHFLACCSKDAEGTDTQVDIDVAGEKFTLHGLVIHARNYLDVYPYDLWTAKQIPSYQQGQQFQSKPEMRTGETTAPELLTEADLIALMERHGIGTDATHADHIDKIKERQYAAENPENRRFVPGFLGLGLFDGYAAIEETLTKPVLRAELEADLKRIEQGVKSKDAVLREQLAKYKAVFMKAEADLQKLDQAMGKYFNVVPQTGPPTTINMPRAVASCSTCSQPMMLKTKQAGGFLIGCSAYPACKEVIWLPNEGIENAEVTDTACQRCTTRDARFVRFRLVQSRFSVPVPRDYEGCVLCDDELRMWFSISHDHRSSDTTRNASTSTIRTVPLQVQQRVPPAAPARSTPPVVVPECFCGLSALRKQCPTTSKMNAGRFFYACPNGACGFVQWLSIDDVLDDDDLFPGCGGGGDGGPPSPPPRPLRPPPHSLIGAVASLSDRILCDCGIQAISFECKKDGSNKGRWFHKCGDNSKCRFFQWDDELPTGNRPQLPAVPGRPALMGTTQLQATQRPRQGNFAAGAGDANAIVCNCGLDAVLRTVRKEGANKGRQFYACPKPQGATDNCMFFLWTDSPDTAADTSGGFSGPMSSNNRGTASNIGTAVPDCLCGLPSTIRRMNKAPNEGREFYTCPKPSGWCKFFQWVDEGAGTQRAHTFSADASPPRPVRPFGGGGGGGGGAGGSVRRRRSSPSDGGAKKPRAPGKCSYCKQEGHTRRKCPFMLREEQRSDSD